MHRRARLARAHGLAIIRRVSPQAVIAIGSLSLLFASSACSPTSRAGRNDAVVPTPPVLSAGDEQTPRIGVRGLVVSYQGARDAPAQVTRSKPEAVERAKMVATIAQMSGEHFQELTLKYGDRPLLPDSDSGALLERGAGTVDEAVERAAFALATNQVSSPIETPDGFVIVQRIEAPDGGPTQIGARHILVSYRGAQRAAPEVTRSKEEARTLAERVAREADGGADWQALWEQHSNEPGGQRGGDLGLFGRGQMVPAFEHAAFELQVGQVSEVIETPFGFHVIQRTK